MLDKRSSALRMWNYVLLALLFFDSILIPLEIAFDDVCPVGWNEAVVDPLLFPEQD